MSGSTRGKYNFGRDQGAKGTMLQGQAQRPGSNFGTGTLKLSLFLKTFSFFALAQILGLVGAQKIKDIIRVVQPSKIDFSIAEIALFLLVITVFIFILKKFGSRSPFVYRFFLGFSIFLGTQAIFSVFILNFLNIILAALATYLFFSYRIVLLHNLILILAIVGIGLIFGVSIKPIQAVFLLLIFSIYDIIAVYKTKHMVKMAEDMIRANAVFGLIIPFNIRDFFSKLGQGIEREKFMILGSGDVAFPIILISSATLVSVFSGVMVMIFSFIGMFITHLIFNLQPVRKPMAALPPIAAASIIGYLISIL